MLVETGGFAVWVWLFDGGFVCAWFDDGVVELEGWLDCAWLGELPEAGACVIFVVPGFVDCPVEFWPIEVDGCVCAEVDEGVLDEGLVVCAVPAEGEGVLEADGVGVAVKFCWAVGELEPDVPGDDCAKAEVAIATAAVVARKNKCLFI